MSQTHMRASRRTLVFRRLLPTAVGMSLSLIALALSTAAGMMLMLAVSAWGLLRALRRGVVARWYTCLLPLAVPAASYSAQAGSAALGTRILSGQDALDWLDGHGYRNLDGSLSDDYWRDFYDRPHSTPVGPGLQGISGDFDPANRAQTGLFAALTPWPQGPESSRFRPTSRRKESRQATRPRPSGPQVSLTSSAA